MDHIDIFLLSILVFIAYIALAINLWKVSRNKKRVNYQGKEQRKTE